jgi:adenylate cyclase
MRVRRVGERYILTLKVGAGGLARHEIEWDAAPSDGRQILDHLCLGEVVTKTRHLVEHAGKIWEIDVFDGANAGLIVAEIELTAENEAFEKPAWLGPEVTNDGRFYNASLSTAPFEGWGVSYAAVLTEKSAAI